MNNVRIRSLACWNVEIAPRILHTSVGAYFAFLCVADLTPRMPPRFSTRIFAVDSESTSGDICRSLEDEFVNSRRRFSPDTELHVMRFCSLRLKRRGWRIDQGL